MFWVLLSVMGCYTPPGIDAETSYISDACGLLTKQITVQSDPDTLVTLHRDDEMIAEYRTDAVGNMQVRWPVTSLVGVQARVGRPNTYSAVDLADPPPTLEPVWREGRMHHLRCREGAECTVSLVGRHLELHAQGSTVSLSVGNQEAVTGESTVAQMLSAEQLAQFNLSVSEASSCSSVAGPPLTVEIDGERRVAGWVLSRSQALAVVGSAIADDGVAVESTGDSLLVLQQSVADSLPFGGELLRFDPSKSTSAIAPSTVQTPQDLRAVLRLGVSRMLDISGCAEDTSRVGWRVYASLTDAQTGETTERVFTSNASRCLTAMDIQPESETQVADAVAWAEGAVAGE